jgi:hypothetical protein
MNEDLAILELELCYPVVNFLRVSVSDLLQRGIKPSGSHNVKLNYEAGKWWMGREGP